MGTRKSFPHTSTLKMPPQCKQSRATLIRYVFITIHFHFQSTVVSIECVAFVLLEWLKIDFKCC